MPTNKYLKVKHLKVKESETVPVEVLDKSKILYGEDSGKTFTVSTITSNITVTLPSAEVGRVVKFITNQTPTDDTGPTLGFTVTLVVKNTTTETIVGALLTTSTAGANTISVVTTKNGTTDNSTGFTATAVTGAEINLVCTSKNLWTVTGLGIDPNNPTPVSSFL